MRLGVTVTESKGPDALVALRDDLRRAADDGMSSAWLSHIFGLDALTAIAVAGSQVPEIELGTSVVPSYPRHPAALAQQALTTSLAVQGRLVLGIGVSHQIVIEDMFGFSFARPVHHMSEYLSVLSPLLDGKPSTFAGESLTGKISLSPPSHGRVPVVIAALAPRMLKLAGEQADGTVLWMAGLNAVRDHVAPILTAAATAAGRPAPRVVCLLPVSVTDDPDAARASAAKAFRMYGTLPSYRAVLDRGGATGPADVAVVGDEKAVETQLGELRDAGVTDFVAIEYDRADRAGRTRALLRSLA